MNNLKDFSNAIEDLENHFSEGGTLEYRDAEDRIIEQFDKDSNIGILLFKVLGWISSEYEKNKFLLIPKNGIGVMSAHIGQLREVVEAGLIMAYEEKKELV